MYIKYQPILVPKVYQVYVLYLFMCHEVSRDILEYLFEQKPLAYCLKQGGP